MLLAIVGAALVVAPTSAPSGWVALRDTVGVAEVDVGGVVEQRSPEGLVRVTRLRTYNRAIAALRVERTLQLRCDKRLWRISRIKSYMEGGDVFRDVAVPAAEWQAFGSAAVVQQAADLACQVKKSSE